jgi:methionyl-tRNA synthetase
MSLENPQRYTVTAALIYANGPIHIGHIAGCYLPADIYVRYLRATGKDVAFISGTDEHGVPITIRAQKEGITPQQVVDKYYVQIKRAFEDFGISFDLYSRTSKPIHHETSREFFLNLYHSGNFTEETTEQYYDETAKQFLADRYIVGVCPVCGNPNAYGDQCENCGSTLSPTELKEPLRSMLSGSKPVMKATKNWYLPLDRMQPRIEEYVNSHPEWKTNVMGQCQSWLKEGLRPRAMTRDLDWGIKVPLPDTDGKVLYVWFDAPIGYISMTKEWAEQQGRDWELYWRDKHTKLVHFIGKDNIVFHCIIFPAMLMHEGSGSASLFWPIMCPPTSS